MEKIGGTIDDMCRLSEFEPFREKFKKEGVLQECYDEKGALKQLIFRSKKEAVFLFDSQKDSVEDRSISIVRYCMLGSKNNTIFRDVIRMLYALKVSFIAPNESFKPLNPDM